MNQPIKLLRCVTWAALFAVALVNSGCIPYPHRNKTSGEMSGRVYDAYTGTPIKGATVALVTQPKHRTKSDDHGYFSLSETYKFHFFAYITLAACPPSEDHYDSTIFIRHPAYSVNEGMHVIKNITTEYDYFLTPTNRVEYIKQGLRPVYLVTNSFPLRY
jgi:hypothetical protein